MKMMKIPGVHHSIIRRLVYYSCLFGLCFPIINVAATGTTTTSTTMICPSQADTLLKCLNATNTIEPDACSSCLLSAEERAGDRSKIQQCEAWNTNYCTAIEVCRATCVGVHAIVECTDEFDAYKTCAPTQISQSIQGNQCPFQQCFGAKSVTSAATTTTRRSYWCIAPVLGILVAVMAMLL